MNNHHKIVSQHVVLPPKVREVSFSEEGWLGYLFWGNPEIEL